MITSQFVLAGKAIFTVHNDKNEHFTYKVTKAKNGNLWFASFLTGPDNESNYSYLGVIKENGEFRTTAKSRMDFNSKPVKVLCWVLRLVWNESVVPEGYGINHAGRCGRCGRTLTRPEGIDPEGYRLGFGPECWSKM